MALKLKKSNKIKAKLNFLIFKNQMRLQNQKKKLDYPGLTAVYKSFQIFDLAGY